MYIVIVGPAAVGKGIAMGPAYNMLKRLDITMSAQSTTRQALIEDLTESTTVEIYDGSTVTESNLTIFSKEFSVFLGHQNVELISNITDWFDCENEWTYKTKGRGTEKIEGLFVNLIGATTPGILQKTLTEDAISGGLTSRIVLVYAQEKSKIVPIPMLSTEAPKLLDHLERDLGSIACLHGEFRLTEDVIHKWVDWYIEQESEDTFKNHSRLQGYSGRRPLHLLKLMMIMSASRSDEMVITSDDFDTAVSTLREAEVCMPEVFKGYGQNVLAEFVEIAMNEIRKDGLLSKKDFLRRHVNDLDLEDLNKILGTLEGMGFCSLIAKPSGVYIRYLGG